MATTPRDQRDLSSILRKDLLRARGGLVPRPVEIQRLPRIDPSELNDQLKRGKIERRRREEERARRALESKLSQAASPMSGIDTFLSWFGALASGLSLFRLLNMAVGFGLSPPFRLVLRYYVNFFHPIADFFRPLVVGLAHLFGVVDLPPWWREVFIAYALIGAALLRHSILNPDAVTPSRNPFARAAKGAHAKAPSSGTCDGDQAMPSPFGKFAEKVRLRALQIGLAALWPIFPFFIFVAGKWVARDAVAAIEAGDIKHRDIWQHTVPGYAKELMSAWRARQMRQWRGQILRVIIAAVAYVLMNAAL